MSNRTLKNIRNYLNQLAHFVNETDGCVLWKRIFFFPFLLKFSLRWLYLCPKGSRDRKLDTPCSYKGHLSGDNLWLPIPWWKLRGWLLMYPICIVLSQSGFESPYTIPCPTVSFPLGMLLLHILSISLPLVWWAIESQSWNKNLVSLFLTQWWNMRGNGECYSGVDLSAGQIRFWEIKSEFCCLFSILKWLTFLCL